MTAAPVDPPTVETEPITEQHGWLTPEELVLAEALDKAADRLRASGFTVARHAVGRTIEAEYTVGDHLARLSLLEGTYWLVERQWTEDDGRRLLVDEQWPKTLAAAVDLAVQLAGELKEAHEARQEPAVFGDEILAGHDAEIPADVAERGAA